MSNTNEIATLGGGCFWCLEAVFEQMKGVERVVSGYAGGHVDNPTYQQVCSETTGHAEVVQVTFDPMTVSYPQILRVFFTIHDPTTLNRQGNDRGTQYRSIIFYHNDAQRAAAEEVMSEVARSSEWNAPLVTELKPLEKFYPAEGYHQAYFRGNENQPYCQFVVAPKVAKFRTQFATLLKS
jgi:peptide-methionine (S)-S-oxide reductase